MPEKKLRVSEGCENQGGETGCRLGELVRVPVCFAFAGVQGVSTMAAHFFNGNRTMGSGKDDQGNAPSLLQVLGSVLASMFGVQSNRRREQDFVHGKPSQYIVIGLLVTLVFILLVWGVVSLVMRLAGV